MNLSIQQEEFFFPKGDEPAEKTCLRDLPGRAMASGGGLTVLMRACCVRAAISKPEMRAAIGAAGSSDIDWKRVEENDKRFSHVLQEALTRATRLR
jgi:hypothetical protein